MATLKQTSRVLSSVGLRWVEEAKEGTRCSFAVACAFYFPQFSYCYAPACVCVCVYVSVCISALNELVAPVSVVAVAFLAKSGIEVSERWMI